MSGPTIIEFEVIEDDDAFEPVDPWELEHAPRSAFARLGRTLFSWWRSDTINTERAGHHGEGRWEVADPEDANLVSSRIQGREGWHSPVLDIDFPARLVPSATPGHYHLYLDRPMPWAKYEELLHALAKARIISRHYLKHSVLRRATMARPPWVEKIVPPGGFDSSGDEAVEVEL